MSANWDQLAACPICGSETIKEVLQGDKFEDGLHTYLCDDCAVSFTNPMPSEAHLDHFYRTDYRKRYSGYKQPSHKYIARLGRDVRARYHADFVLKSGGLKDDVSLIDIGAAEGSFLKAMAEVAGQYRNVSSIGVEPNTEFSHWGLENGYYDHVVDNISKVDVSGPVMISMIHVLEHIREPVKFLAELVAKHDDLTMFVDVPDTTEYKSVAEVHLAHLYHFTEHSLVRCFERAGLSVMQCERHSPPSHPKSIRIIGCSTGGEQSMTHFDKTPSPAEELTRVKAAYARIEDSRRHYFSAKQRLIRGLKKIRRLF